MDVGWDSVFTTREGTFTGTNLYICALAGLVVTGLIVWMGFIVWDLAKKSQAGRFGTIILFTILGAGVVGFIIKTVMVEIMQL